MHLRLNHAVLFVRDLAASLPFYRDTLGFSVAPHGDDHPGAVFLRAPGSANDHDLGLFAIGPQAQPSAAGQRAVGLYHLAWEVDTLAELDDLRHTLTAAGALHGASDHGMSKSLYGRDPDGLEFEIVWIVPAHLAVPRDREAGRTIRPLEIEREIATYGHTALSGTAQVTR